MKKKSMLAALVMLSLLQGSVYAANQNIVIENQSDYDNYKNEDDNIVLKGGNNTISISGVNNDDYEIIAGNTVSNKVTIANSELGIITGASSDIKSANNNIITIDGSMVESVYGAKVNQYNDEIDCYTPVSAEDNYVTVTNNSTIYSEVYGAQVWYGDASNNHLNISDTEFIGYTGGPGGAIYAGAQVTYGTVENNSVTITNCKAEGEFVGGVTYFGSAINNTVKIENLIPMVEENLDVSNLSRVYVFGGQSSGNFLNENLDNYSNKPSAVQDNRIEIYGKNKIHGIYGGYGFAAPVPELVSINKNYVDIYGEVETLAIYGGYSCCTSGYDGIKVINNRITLFDGSKVEGIIIAGGSEEIGTEVRGTSINLQGSANVKNADLYGYAFDEYLGAVSSDKVSNNNLIIDGWTGTANSVQNFNNIKFNNLVWNTNPDEAVLTTNSGNLDGTNVSFTLQSGQKVNVGDSMTLVSSSADLGTIANAGESINTTMGVAADVSATLEQTGNKVMATVDNIELNDQTMLVAENRAVAAAFVNQGTDLIADSLDTLSRDGKYGVKTFAAVHGNRSKYDVNSDIKINGWSTIVGVGAENEHNGGDFSWGVFYENGSGNYRTFNSFNNEYFRGDGSLVYNGGGIAARYENAHGVYTEGSLRAGMLKSDMDNALSDGENKYGYSSESEYYGAHIGIGQIIPLSESSDLDVYGKFFHTYTEGDSFKVDTDEFEFDSINSDRLRVGARLTTNKENKFSTYYGLAYEYEFNGDAEMRAAGMSAPTQSLQGSSCMAEVGFNYQPTPDSPWSFDLNMRGYAGEREGATFNVQATYTF